MKKKVKLDNDWIRYMNELKRVSHLLKKLVHHKDCQYFLECPREHRKCEEKLNEATACYWIAGGLALAAYYFSSEVRTEEFENRFASVQLKSYNERIHTIRCILDMHQDNGKNSEAIKLMKYAKDALGELYWKALKMERDLNKPKGKKKK